MVFCFDGTQESLKFFVPRQLIDPLGSIPRAVNAMSSWGLDCFLEMVASSASVLCLPVARPGSAVGGRFGEAHRACSSSSGSWHIQPCFQRYH